MKNPHKQANKMFNVSFVLMKTKSHFNFIFAFGERSLQRLLVENTHTLYSLPLYPIAVRICFLFSVKNKLKECCETFFFTILDKNHIFLNEARWEEIRK